MITRTSTVSLTLSGTMLQDCDPDSLLFFDIETTGFTADTSSLYLIGAITRQENGWILTQWLAQSEQEESSVLEAFLAHCSAKKQLIHFNGDRFDLPYLHEKCSQYGLTDTLSSMVSRDLYRMIRPLKTLLNLSSLNQRSLEEYLGIFRRDPYSGGELIRVYREYTEDQAAEKLQKLLLHNREDLLGMTDLLPLLSYHVILNGSFQVTGYEIEGDSLILRSRLPLFLPQVFSYKNSWFYLTGQQDRIAVSIHGFRGTLKYFFPDYKNYYYLPEEDVAMHKSVAAYVDRDHREPAKAATCYNRKKGFYLPQFEELFSPVFKTDYHEKQQYFSCNDPFLQDPDALFRYFCHLLDHL